MAGVLEGQQRTLGTSENPEAHSSHLWMLSAGSGLITSFSKKQILAANPVSCLVPDHNGGINSAVGLVVTSAQESCGELF